MSSELKQVMRKDFINHHSDISKYFEEINLFKRKKEREEEENVHLTDLLLLGLSKHFELFLSCNSLEIEI